MAALYCLIYKLQIISYRFIINYQCLWKSYTSKRIYKSKIQNRFFACSKHLCLHYLFVFNNFTTSIYYKMSPFINVYHRDLTDNEIIQSLKLIQFKFRDISVFVFRDVKMVHYCTHLPTITWRSLQQ